MPTTIRKAHVKKTKTKDGHIKITHVPPKVVHTTKGTKKKK